MDPLELFAAVTLGVSAWLLAKNKSLGWLVGLVGFLAYAVVFYRVRLFAEVGLQIVYFVTGLQAIWIWRHGGQQRQERPVGRVTLRWALLTPVLAALSVWGVYELLVILHGAVPFWNALTTVMGLVAHIYLMLRLVESWWIWIAVNAIYIPLYLSLGLHLTSVLCIAFLIMAIYGLLNFLRIYREQRAAA